MPGRVNPVVLLGIVSVAVLSLSVVASHLSGLGASPPDVRRERDDRRD
jgi:hypothetical protein